jgi:hypothetical protein
MEISSQYVVWFHYGKPALPIRWVLIRDPAGQYETVYLLCTGPQVAPRLSPACFIHIAGRLALDIGLQFSYRAS